MENNIKKTILYIEDESDNRELLKKMLTAKGYNYFEAEDGLSGIEIALKEKIDLIILDINMSGMTGYEIATKIKNIPKLKDIPLVAFTGNVIHNAKERALISGCEGFMTKPINGTTFFEKLNEYLNGKKDFIPPEMIPELVQEYNIELVNHLEKEIIELKRLNDDLKQLDKLKSDFISIVSHELRTPLVTIIGYNGLLLSKRLGTLSPEHEKIISIVDRNSKRLERIIRDIFTLSQIDSTKQKLLTTVVDPIKQVKTILEDNALILADRSLEAKFNLEGLIPAIEADEDKFFQAISNIFNNAIKFTENSGLIEITLRYPSRKVSEKYGLDPNKYIEIIIEDTGIGIPKNMLNKIFDRFVELGDIERHHSSDTEFMGGGAGIGLSISKGIVKKHCGYIWAENKEDKGSRFITIFPIKIDETMAIIPN